MSYDPSENKWKLAHGNAAGRLWRYIEKNLMISKKHLKRVKKGKFTPSPVFIDFKDWYKD